MERHLGRETYALYDVGCRLLSQSGEYGQLIGSLELKSRYDVSQFVSRSAESEALPLSSLTDGIHLHTLLCPDEEAYMRVKAELSEAGFLLPEEEA